MSSKSLSKQGTFGKDDLTEEGNPKKKTMEENESDSIGILADISINKLPIRSPLHESVSLLEYNGLNN